MLLVQFKQADGSRLVGSLEQDGKQLRVIDGYRTTYSLARAAIAAKTTLQAYASAALGSTLFDYAQVAASGHLLAPLDHDDSAHCYVTGTGLTHLGSADGRDAMHKKLDGADTLTDSMKMFRMGLENGKPEAGQIGVQPEWFYKGDGSIVRAAEQPLEMPHFALDGGEEPEIAGLYLIGDDGQPWRVGFAIGNEFSDHVTERQNYLYLAHSKLRVCSLGPVAGRIACPRTRHVTHSRPGWRSALGKTISERRRQHVAHGRQSGTSPFQICAVPPSRRYPHPFLRHRHPELFG